MEKQRKRERIARETLEVEQSLKILKNDEKPKKKKVTAASLRSMNDVVSEVDRLMDKHMKVSNNADESSSEEVESDVISSSKGSTSSSTKKVQGAKQSEKKVSGKSKNSLNSDIKFPQKWGKSAFRQQQRQKL